MELNQFRDVDVVLDKANDNIIQKQFVSAGDKDGRSLTVQLTDNGVIGEIIGATLNLYWHNVKSGLTDLSAFYVVDRATSVFKIDYPQNMLTPGKVIAYIQILHGGKVTHTKPFEITVQNLAGTTRGVLGTAEYGALVTTLAKANEFETEIAEVTAQLAQTVKQGQNESVTKAMLAQDLKEELNNGEIEFVLNTSEIEDNAVTPEKASFILESRPSRNLFDKSTVTMGYRFNSQDRVTLEADPNYACIMYIPVIPGSTLTKNKEGAFAWYRADKSPISGYGNGEGPVTRTITNDAYFVSLNMRIEDVDTYQLEYGSVATEYEEGGLKPHILDNTIKVPIENLIGENDKQNKLIAGDGIMILDDVISAIGNDNNIDFIDQIDFVELIKSQTKAFNKMTFFRTASNTFDVRLSNGEIGVVYSWVKDPNDDFFKIHSCGTGLPTDTTLQNIILAGTSNKEFAFTVTKNATTNWIPEHNGIGSLFADEQSVILNDESIILSDIPVGFSREIYNFELVQNMRGQVQGQGDVMIFNTKNNVTLEGVINFEGSFETLTDLKITGYPAMLPSNPLVVKTFVSGVGDVKVSKGDESNTFFSEESDDVHSVAVVDGNFIGAVRVMSPFITLRKNKAGKPESGKRLFLWERANAPKVYFNVFDSLDVPSGYRYVWGSKIAVSKINNISLQILQ